MKDIDYENLFVYMSLIFAICIFIVLLYGCAFANPRGSSGSGGFGGSALIIENFEGESDIKTQVLTLLKELEDKSTTSSENKTKIKEIREKINNNNINVDELKTLIGLLKDMASSKDDEKKSSDSKDSKDSKEDSNEDTKDSKDSKEDTKDSKS